MNNKETIRTVGLVFICAVFLILLVRSFVINNPVFDISPKEDLSYSWEAYLKDREKRNIKKMNRSYAEVMSLARAYMAEGELKRASSAFFEAKTIFPDRIEPRKNLCYIYLKLCPENSRYCKKAKREIYFAMKYAREDDPTNFNYLSDLASLVDIDDILSLPEGEALSVIF